MNLSSAQAGRQRQGALWSSLDDVLKLLHVDVDVPASGQEALFAHRRYRAGQRIFTLGQDFDALYIVHSGFLKTSVLDDAGNEKVLGFPMKRDVLGVDAISSGRHASEAVALCETDLIVLPFAEFNALIREVPALESLPYQLMSRELAQQHAMVGLLGTLSAEARVSRFLAAHGDRYGALGFSSKAFQLRMTRQEIGSYLGLTLETVSRALSALAGAGVIAIEQRSVEILDPQALRTLTRVPSAAEREKKAANAAAAGTRGVAAQAAWFPTVAHAA